MAKTNIAKDKIRKREATRRILASMINPEENEGK
jgi:hypothetical protein